MRGTCKHCGGFGWGEQYCRGRSIPSRRVLRGEGGSPLGVGPVGGSQPGDGQEQTAVQAKPNLHPGTGNQF